MPYNSGTRREFYALQYGLCLNLFIQAISAFLFLAGSWYLLDDKNKVAHAVAASNAEKRAAISSDAVEPNEV